MVVTVRLKPKILPAALALGLLAIGIPQTGDSIFWLVTGDTRDQLGAASPSSAVDAARNAVLFERAGDWFGDGNARIRAGILRLRLATSGSPNELNAAEISEIDRALADLRGGLAQAPANAMGWSALAQGALAAGDRPGARAALSASMLLDDHDPELSLWRCALGLALWSYLDDDDRRMWNDQVSMAWNDNPDNLVALARQNGGAYAMPIRLSLLSDHARLRDFDRRFNGR